MKSHFPIVELGKYVRQASQRNRAEADIEVFSVTNSEGFTRSTDYFSKEVFSKDISNYKVVSPGQFAYNPSRINVGSIDYLRHGNPVLVSPLYIVFEGIRDIYADYLLRYLKSRWGNAQIRANTEGAVRDSLKFKGLESIKLPLPSLDDQIRIAHLLGKVEGLIAQRKQHLQELDDLLKSVFLEMFGDPILNPHGFPARRLSEFYVNPKEGTKCGPFGSALKKEELVDSGVPVWNMDNISTDGQMVLPFRMWITANKYDDLAAYSVQDGDIIISRAGTVGKMCVARMSGQPAIISTNLIRLRLGADLRPLHFVSLMLYCKGRVGRLKTGSDGAFTHMNTGVLDSLEFPYPPVELQDQFGTIANKVENLKVRYQESAADLEVLYGALSQQAFKGELDLSRVPLPAIPIEGEHTVASAPLPAQTAAPAINLPDNDLLLKALENREHLKPLLHQWLEAYRAQLGGAAFSVERFTAAAQTRLAELHPDNDFELGAGAYEHIKRWVFDALAAGKLEQAFDSAGNRIQLKTVQA
ncbi:restriction endonuclease subunit S [Azotobacter beijerinckii]|uniref:Type I restriction enzyme, S subunit n=1 Tax=Azotobacter beijerinckii TaxID=170623 RepID=A0A1I4IEG1_9GAMM|nr:restriction endonuclease subunit S [Azotobacter beijerinckii]SFB64216.1 type I restriction enzyme, S subunit [Azotobacter beijerinckii]SFL52758.1 type I restriction enzyme, S subunit [Azotobacter beijerinckii]